MDGSAGGLSLPPPINMMDSGGTTHPERNMRGVKAVGVVTLLATVSPAIAGPRAEAVARCQAIQDGNPATGLLPVTEGKKEGRAAGPVCAGPRGR